MQISAQSADRPQWAPGSDPPTSVGGYEEKPTAHTEHPEPAMTFSGHSEWCRAGSLEASRRTGSRRGNAADAKQIHRLPPVATTESPQITQNTQMRERDPPTDVGASRIGIRRLPSAATGSRAHRECRCHRVAAAVRRRTGRHGSFHRLMSVATGLESADFRRRLRLVAHRAR
mgnify:CR=1 FL=1|jgi:hypothetical protein